MPRSRIERNPPGDYGRPLSPDRISKPYLYMASDSDGVDCTRICISRENFHWCGVPLGSG